MSGPCKHSTGKTQSLRQLRFPVVLDGSKQLGVRLFGGFYRGSFQRC